ncbi:hypothetical protein BS78_05G194300 [Paspalum vaginatum]|nr:hypothetical protein BS78_05G194300 [Paspalum vaginatum]
MQRRVYPFIVYGPWMTNTEELPTEATQQALQIEYRPPRTPLVQRNRGKKLYRGTKKSEHNLQHHKWPQLILSISCAFSQTRRRHRCNRKVKWTKIFPCMPAQSQQQPKLLLPQPNLGPMPFAFQHLHPNYKMLPTQTPKPQPTFRHQNKKELALFLLRRRALLPQRTQRRTPLLPMATLSTTPRPRLLRAWVQRSRLRRVPDAVRDRRLDLAPFPPPAPSRRRPRSPSPVASQSAASTGGSKAPGELVLGAAAGMNDLLPSAEVSAPIMGDALILLAVVPMEELFSRPLELSCSPS